jgi:hypothetical protein
MNESVEDKSIWWWCIIYIFSLLLFVKFNVLSKWKQIVSVKSWLMSGKWHMEFARPLCSCGPSVDVTNWLVEMTKSYFIQQISRYYLSCVLHLDHHCHEHFYYCVVNMTTTEWLPQCYSARAVYLQSCLCRKCRIWH